MLFISEEEREGRRLGRLQQSSKEDSARMQGQTQEENCIKTTFLPGHKWVEVLRKDVHNMEVVVDLEKHHLGLQLVTLTVVSVQLVTLSVADLRSTFSWPAQMLSHVQWKII